jgi:AAA+ superfamily predicted ATPase
VSDALFSSLFAALEADAGNTALRLQVAQLLHERGRHEEAVTQAAMVLAQEPGDAVALDLLTRASASMRGVAPDRGSADQLAEEPSGEPSERASSVGRTSERGSSAGQADDADFDWHRAESDLGTSGVPAPFSAPDTPSIPGAPGPAAADTGPTVGGEDVLPVLDELGGRVTLADVGGLDAVKQRLRESFLEPMRHPELAAAFGKTLRGGLVLYGPPGCGKTFMARAIAGELGARFLTTDLADLLGSHFGETEKNLHALFEQARSATPAVLFLDEIDAIGAKRSGIGSGWSGMRAMVDQLLMELDSLGSDNDGLFVLAATNSPWDVDPALLRPGRLDRTLLVLPPDAPARDAILRMHLTRRPIAGIDVDGLVRATDGYSGADLEHLVASAAEQAMLRSISAGEVQPVNMADLQHVLREIRPSTGAWLASAKNVVTFANTDGRYDDLAAYLRARGLL